ncbi:MAG: hypothetical protein WA086_20195 [Ideonella sp.]
MRLIGMNKLMVRIVLLQSHPSPPAGLGRLVFRIGQSIGAGGRILLAACLVLAAFAAIVEQRTVLLSFVFGYAVIAVLVLTEVLSSVLMFLGNWLAAKA